MAGQTVTTAWLEGVVRSAEDGTPVAGARVYLEDAWTSAVRATLTDVDGRYRLTLLPPGEYDVTAEKLGYTPSRIRGMQLTAGLGSSATFDLSVAAPPVLEAEVADGRFRRTGDPVARHLGRLELREMGLPRSDVSALALLLTTSDRAMVMEGLPAQHARFVSEGRGFAPLLHPHLGGEVVRVPQALPGLRSLDVLSNPVDVEWSGATGPFLRTTGRGGTGVLSGRSWGGIGFEAFEPTEVGSGHDLWRAGAEVSGPMVADTAFFSVGAEWRRVRRVIPPVAGVAELLEVMAPGLSDRPGVEATALGLDDELDVASAWGRFDWRLNEGNEAVVDAAVTVQPAGLDGAWGVSGPWLRPTPAGLAASASGSLRSVLSERFSNEIRAGVTFGRSDYELGDGLLAFGTSGIPATHLVGTAVTFGADPSFPAEFERLALGLDQRLLMRVRRHEIKIGFDVAWETWSGTYAWGRTGMFTFAGAEEMEAGRGSYVQTVSPAPTTSFAQLRTAAILQDRWRPAPGLDVTFGLRLDADRVTRHSVDTAHEWESLTALLNTAADLDVRRLSPRAGFRWNVRESDRWILQGGLGIYHEPMRPEVLAELATHDGATTVRRGFGEVGSVWPAAPVADAAPSRGPAITMPGPDFTSPRTSRTSLGIARHGATSVTVSGTYRHTDFLPRRRDLNRLPVATAQDQYGRPIYGNLLQEGALVGAEPGSNRLFAGFDMVSALEVTGASDYWGLTFLVERRAGSALELAASYTYSETTDNWVSYPGRSPMDQLAPSGLEALVGGDWADGISDFDIPHRLALAARLAPDIPLQPTFAAAFRVQSGLPFTAGFARGVDVSGDYASNDPAVIDPTLPGMAVLLESWPCLGETRGGFAVRNACRTDGTHALDLRAGLGFAGAGGLGVRLNLEALNVLERELTIPDRAVLLIDPEGSLSVDGGVVNIPFLANPGFGDPVRTFRTGRVLRVGLELSF